MYNDQFRGGANLTRWDGVMKLTKMGITVKGTIIGLVILLAVGTIVVMVLGFVNDKIKIVPEAVTASGVINSVNRKDNEFSFSIPKTDKAHDLCIVITGVKEASDGSFKHTDITNSFFPNESLHNNWAVGETYAFDIGSEEYVELRMEAYLPDGERSTKNFVL